MGAEPDIGAIKAGVEGISATETVAAENLSTLVRDMFVYCGVSEADARIATEVSVYAQMHGSQSHGVLHMPLYVRGLLDGTMKAAPNFEMTGELAACRLLDADNGLGLVASRFALDAAIGMAKTNGLGAVAVRNSSHFGMAGYYVDYAANQGLIAFSFSNASPAIAPTGAKEGLLGTNPIGAGFPISGSDPLIVDMATAMVARSRIRQADTRGEEIPPGWALDADGQPTTDAAAALQGSVQPIGGPKGYGLALVVEMLCTALSDGQPGFEVTYENFVKRSSRIGQFFLVMDPAGFAGLDAYGKRAAHIADVIKNAAPLGPGPPPRLPGARGHQTNRQYEDGGIPVTDTLRKALGDAAAMLEDG